MTKKLPSHAAEKTDPIRWTCSVCGRVVYKSLDVFFSTNIKSMDPDVTINIPLCHDREMLAGESHDDGKLT